MIALELAGRRVEGTAVARARSARSRRTSKRSGRRRKRRPVGAAGLLGLPRFSPAPGGHWSWRDRTHRKRNSQRFSDGRPRINAIQSVALVRPAVARELLLAVSLDEPKRESEYEREVFSLPGFANGRTARLPCTGKAHSSVCSKPLAEGLEAVLRLVNFATNQWLRLAFRHTPSEEERRGASEFVVEGKSLWWPGNGNVFNWHRDEPNIPDVVIASLMALEKWLYDLLEKVSRLTAGSKRFSRKANRLHSPVCWSLLACAIQTCFVVYSSPC